MADLDTREKADARHASLYASHGVRVERVCRLVLSDADLAKDVAQDVFLKVAANPPPADADEARWLTRVAVNACKDVRRSRWWKTWFRRTDEYDDARAASANDDPERQALRAEEVRRIHSALARLSPRQREVFVLRHVEEWSTEEVAGELGVSEGSVKQHLFRAVAALRGALGEDEE